MNHLLQKKIHKYIKSYALSRLLSSIIFFIFSFFGTIIYYFPSKKIKISSEEAKKIIEEKRKFTFRKTRINPFAFSESIDLSVIIPVYNAEKYLLKCTNSIMSQKTNYSFELILVNDGSTDKSPLILKELSKNSNVVIINQRNMGAAAARNRGIENAKGRYVLFVDADDILQIGALENMIRVAITNDADLVYGDIARFSRDDELKSENQKLFISKLIDLKNSPYQIFYINGSPWGKLYKRELWKAIRFPEGYNFEDSIIRPLIVKNSKKIYHLQQTVYAYRRNMESITFEIQGSNKALDSFWILEYILNSCRINHFDIDELLILLMIDQLGSWDYGRLYHFDNKTLSALVILSYDLLKPLVFHNSVRLNYWHSRIKKGILTKNLNKWKVSSFLSKIS